MLLVWQSILLLFGLAEIVSAALSISPTSEFPNPTKDRSVSSVLYGDVLYASYSNPIYAIAMSNLSILATLTYTPVGSKYIRTILPVNGYLFAGGQGQDCFIQQWFLSNYSAFRNLSGGSDQTYALAAGENYIFAGMASGVSVLQWDMQNGTNVFNYTNGMWGVIPISVTTDSVYAGGGGPTYIARWSRSMNQSDPIQKYSSLFNALVFALSVQGNDMVSGSWNYLARWSDISNGTIYQTYSYTGQIYSISFVGQSRVAVGGLSSICCSIMQWLLNGSVLTNDANYFGHTDQINQIYFSYPYLITSGESVFQWIAAGVTYSTTTTSSSSTITSKSTTSTSTSTTTSSSKSTSTTSTSSSTTSAKFSTTSTSTTSTMVTTPTNNVQVSIALNQNIPTGSGLFVVQPSDMSSASVSVSVSYALQISLQYGYQATFNFSIGSKTQSSVLNFGQMSGQILINISLPVAGIAYAYSLSYDVSALGLDGLGTTGSILIYPLADLSSISAVLMTCYDGYTKPQKPPAAIGLPLAYTLTQDASTLSGMMDMRVKITGAILSFSYIISRASSNSQNLVKRQLSPPIFAPRLNINISGISSVGSVYRQSNAIPITDSTTGLVSINYNPGAPNGGTGSAIIMYNSTALSNSLALAGALQVVMDTSGSVKSVVSTSNSTACKTTLAGGSVFYIVSAPGGFRTGSITTALGQLNSTTCNFTFSLDGIGTSNLSLIFNVLVGNQSSSGSISPLTANLGLVWFNYTIAGSIGGSSSSYARIQYNSGQGVSNLGQVGLSYDLNTGSISNLTSSAMGITLGGIIHTGSVSPQTSAIPRAGISGYSATMDMIYSVTLGAACGLTAGAVAFYVRRIIKSHGIPVEASNFALKTLQEETSLRRSKITSRLI